MSPRLPDTVAHWPLDRLRPYARNPRTHSEDQVAQIAASIVEFGWTNPVLAAADGTVIAGHGRIEAARRLGLDPVPVVVLDHLTPAQRRALIEVMMSEVLEAVVTTKSLAGVMVVTVDPHATALAKRLGGTLNFLGTKLSLDEPPSDEELLALIAGAVLLY